MNLINRLLAVVVSTSAIGLSLTPEASAQTPYLLSDTTSWHNSIGGGRMATLTSNGHVVDTVDLFSGVSVSSAGLVYQPVVYTGRFSECGMDEICRNLGPWSFWNGEEAVDLESRAPGLHRRLSKPLVEGTIIFYVAVDTMDAGRHMLSARSYDLVDGSVHSIDNLGEVVLEGDAGNPLTPPRILDGCILFELFDSLVVDRRLEPCRSILPRPTLSSWDYWHPGGAVR